MKRSSIYLYSWLTLSLGPSHDLRRLKKAEPKDILMKHGVHYGPLMKRVELYCLFKSKILSRRDEIIDTYYAVMGNQNPIVSLKRTYTLLYKY
jgi:hypothetical protein